MNMHKTFCIPYGSCRTGIGSIGVKSHLVPFMLSHVEIGSAHAVLAATFGSTPILKII